MNRIFWSFALVGLLTFVISIMSLFPSKPSVELEKKLLERVVKISAFNDEQTGHGTGTLLGNGYILTNSHLFPEKGNVSVVFRRHTETENSPAVIISSDTKKDFAILRFKGADATKALPITSKWKLGESIILLGNPGQQDFRFGHTRIMGLTYIGNPFGYVRPMLIFPCDTGAPGFSGSGIWNLKGEYLGIFELYSQGTDMCLAIPAKEVMDLDLDQPWR